jgi:glycosyltransferase involved in cell wall biosynthesis
LAAQGDRVRFVTSRFLYDPSLTAPADVEVDWHYFRAAQRYDRWGAWTRRLYRAWRYPRDHARLLRRIESGEVEKPDVAHLQWSRLPRFDLRFASRLKGIGVRVVHTVHDVEPLYQTAADMSGLGLVYAECDALIVHTQANRNDLMSRYPRLDPKRVRVIPHGPLQGEDRPPGASPEEARRSLGIPTGARVVLNFGSVKSYKGLDLLAAAMLEVHRRVPDAFLLLAGRPATPADAPDLSPLAARGVPHRADFEFIPNRDAWKYYLSADVVVLPYRRITQSGVLLSAMAFERPSIVTAVGGMPEVVREGRTGWIVPPEDVAALENAISDALSDRDRLRAMGRAAKADADEHYSWSAIGKRTDALYRELIRAE